uniref:Endonuclease/exonuclease/phosphatase domain-containing protein n=1 Tax=Photinus pyralis TaxID=7054 RepID=A0A1Y1LIM0_PHOPY
MIKETLHAEELNLNTTLEAIAVNVFIRHKLTICNVYQPRDSPFNEQQTNSTVWGLQYTDSRGRELEKFINLNPINILNDNQPTHFNLSHGTYSNIDLTFASPKIFPLIKWKPMDYLYDSDHYPSQITITGTKKSHLPTSNWKIKSADWAHFKLLTEINHNMEPDPTSIDSSVSYLTDLITQTALTAVGKTKTTEIRHKVPWFNETCKQVVKTAKKAYNYYKKHTNIENCITFKRTRAVARRTIKEAKKEAWRTYVSSINTQTTSTEVWKKIKTLKGTNQHFQINAVKTPSNIVTNKNEIAEIFANFFEHNSCDSNLTGDFLAHKTTTKKSIQPTACGGTEQDINITKPEFYRALQSTKNTSTPGPDDIPYIFIKNVAETCINHILKIYNIIWTHNTTASQNNGNMQS